MGWGWVGIQIKEHTHELILLCTLKHFWEVILEMSAFRMSHAWFESVRCSEPIERRRKASRLGHCATNQCAGKGQGARGQGVKGAR